MEDLICLSHIKEGSRAVVRQLPPAKSARRLHEVGFHGGCRVTSLFSSSDGDLCAYLVKGCVIALRECDAASIKVSPEGRCYP